MELTQHLVQELEKVPFLADTPPTDSGTRTHERASLCDPRGGALGEARRLPQLLPYLGAMIGTTWLVGEAPDDEAGDAVAGPVEAR